MALLRRDRSDGAEADEAEPRRRRGASSERQLAASVSSLRLAARVVRWVAGLFAVVIALGILFVVLDANPHNAIASTIHDWAVALVGPFKNLFHPKTPKLTVAVNWGVALVFYLLVGWLIAGVLRGVAGRVAAD
jgi:hypothetical protein